MQNMLAYNTDWYGHKTFRLMPINNDCPFVEAIYDPTTKVLAIIGKTLAEKPIMLPKLNDKGQPISLKTPDNRTADERRIISTFTEYYLDNFQDIRAFIDRFAVNPDHIAITAMLYSEATEIQEPQAEQEG